MTQTLASQLGFEATQVAVPGLGTMHVVTSGPVTGQPVILLHGFPDFWFGWRHQIPALAAAGYRVFAPDQRGYNETSKSPPYDLATVAADVVGLLAALRLERAHIVGHDWGAAAAWALASLHPERVARMIILNVPHPLAYERELARPNLRQWLRSYYIALFQMPWLPEWSLRRNTFSFLASAMRASARPGTFPDDILDEYRHAWSMPGALSAMLGWYRALGSTSRLLSRHRRQFGRVAAPTLILWGDRDVALVPALPDASMTYLVDGRLVHVPPASHWLHVEYPELVNQHLLEHLAGLEANFAHPYGGDDDDIGDGASA